MGFLDHSTNNIIVDAVLTDKGRQMLARNDGSFKISQFSLGDDEVDYEVIRQFGRTVGKEKIEKNTPIMEALTNGSIGIKHKLVSSGNEFLTHFPVLELSLTSGAGTLVSLKRNSTNLNDTRKEIQVSVSSKTDAGIDDNLRDSSFRVEINNLFLEVLNEDIDLVMSDNIAQYHILPEASTDTEVTTKFTVKVKNITDTTFNTFSASGQTYIRTFVKVFGLDSGISKNIEVQISNPS